MIKKVIILLFISWQACFGQWKQSGIAEVISTNQSGIRDFVITEDSKFIYTLHDNGVIKKWDYETGDSLGMITVHKLEKSGDTTFLSKDGKTYCQCIYNYDGLNSEIIVFDMNGFKIDSIQIYIMYANISYGKLSTNLLDYNSGLKRLTFSMNYTITKIPPYFYETSGLTTVFEKNQNKWVQLYKTESSIVSMSVNVLDSLFFFNFYYNSGSTPHGGSQYYSDDYTLTGILYEINAKKSDTLSHYNRSYNSNTGNSYKGSYHNFKYSFFSRDNNYLYLSEGNKLYYYVIKDKELSPPITLSDYTAKPVRIERASDSNYFFVISNNEINLHDLQNGILNNTVYRSDISNILKFSNAWDDNYIFFSDSLGILYRIENKRIFRLWANFIANDMNISAGKAVKFFDRSIGNPEIGRAHV